MANRDLPRFQVLGGPFALTQEMGWHIVNEKGLTVAVSPDETLSGRLNMLEDLVQLIRDTYTRSCILEELEGEDLENATKLLEELEIE